MKTKALKRPEMASSTVASLPQPPARNAEEYLRAYIGYIYTAVGAITQEVASIDLHLYKAKFSKTGEPKVTEIFEHPALSVLHYVNDITTLYDVLEATQTYLELTGEAYWIVLKEGKTPREFWLVRPDWMKIIPGTNDVIDHYEYHPGGSAVEKVDIPRENVIPFKYFNPLNPYRGKGATQAAALPFDILNFAQEYNRNFFFNSAVPSMVFSTDQKVSDQAIKRFVAQWQASFGGRSKSNKVAFLGNGMKIDKASFGAKELDFNEQMKTMRDDVLAVFKVPKTVLGLTDDVNRANADATTRAFMERVITPRMRRLVNILNEFYLPMFEGEDNSVFFDFTDPSPEDVDMKLKKYENALTHHWMTPNEVRAEENLEPLPGGDDLFPAVPTALKPSNDDTSDDTNENEPVDEDDEPSKPTGDDAPKGFKAMVAKMLGLKVVGKNKVYIPPAYLKDYQEKKRKPMIRFPKKTPKQLEKEELTGAFVEPLKEFISDLIKSGNTPSTKKKGRPTKIDQEIQNIFDSAGKELSRKLSAEKLKEKENEDLHNDWTDAEKKEYWNNWNTKTIEDESDILTATNKVFTEQEQLVLQKLNDSTKALKSQVLGTKATVRDVVPTLGELNKMWGALELVLSDIYTRRGQESLNSLVSDAEFNITTEFAVQYLNEYSGTLIKGINSTTRDALRETLAEGFDAGESVDKLTKRIQAVFVTATVERATMIARTESIRAANTAAVEAYRQSGVVVKKEWLAEQDGRVCPYCASLDGTAISLTKYFAQVGDELTGKDANGNDVKPLTVSYADIGEPPAHVDCRCTTIPVLEKE